MWCEGGKEEYCHSKEEDENSGWRGARLVEKASQIKNKNIRVAIKDIVEPIEETVFHKV